MKNKKDRKTTEEGQNSQLIPEFQTRKPSEDQVYDFTLRFLRDELGLDADFAKDHAKRSRRIALEAKIVSAG